MLQTAVELLPNILADFSPYDAQHTPGVLDCIFAMREQGGHRSFFPGVTCRNVIVCGDGEVADVERGDLDVPYCSEPLNLVLPNTPARYVEVDWTA